MLEALIKYPLKQLKNFQNQQSNLSHPCVYQEVTKVIPVNHPPNAK